MMNLLVWRIAAILLLSILGAVSSSAPGAGGEGEGAPMIIETIRYPSGDVYIGELLADRPHGLGSYKWANGDVYYGEFKYGQMHGKGIHKWASGAVYDGEWENNQRHGEGKMKFKHGDVYDGEWVADKRHGYGRMKFNDGSEYDGQWFKGKRHGGGIQTRMWNIYRYQGEWRNNKRQGKGTAAWFWSFVECEEEWNKDAELRGKPICRAVLLQRLVEVTWHYLVEHYLDLVAVLGVWIGLRALFRREMADVKATLTKLQGDKEKFEAYMKEKLKHDATGEDEELIVGLDQDHIQCGICHEAFTTDMQSTDQTTRDMLPVLGSCGHYFCHGCIIRWRRNMVRFNHGAVGCPKCMGANQFVPGNPTHHRMLIDLLQRARPVEN
jgi:hypothetical protein